jgi:putative inorganic carbon (hco3(-)) transporter
MTVPMLRFLQMQIHNRWGKHLLTLTMLLCTVSALGSQSRGALLATSSMAFLLWWNGRNRIIGSAFFVLTGMALLAFMPETWMERMQTINHYDTDGSALGRLGAWSNAWNLAFDYPFGVGFDAARQDLFDKYSSMPEVGARAAHSIYFQVLGNHGFIGLFFFVMLWISTWISAGWLRRNGGKLPQTKWCGDLGSMMQVSLLGYFVGGSFLSLSYFDLPYDIMIIVVLTRAWVMSKGWESEPVVVAEVEPPRNLGASARLG